MKYKKKRIDKIRNYDWFAIDLNFLIDSQIYAKRTNGINTNAYTTC